MAHNFPMTAKGSLRTFLYLANAILLIVPHFPAVGRAQTPESGSDQQARDKGWKIFEQARQAFRGKADPATLKNYSYDLKTELHTPQGVTQITSHTFFAPPTYVRQEIASPQGPVVIVFDGEHGWQQLATGRRELPAKSVAQIRAELARNNVLIGAKPDPALVCHQGGDEVSGRAVDVVQIADVGGTLLRLFVDTETHDVLKHMFVGDTPQGLAQVEEVFSDFRESDGYRWYHHCKVLRNGKEAVERTLSDIEVNTTPPPSTH